MALDRQMTKERAQEFFEEFFRGEHHFPGEIIEWGSGWAMNIHQDLGTWDFNQLTMLVVMAHDDSIRVGIMPVNMQMMRITLHVRPRGFGANDHPGLAEHVARIRGRRTEWATRQYKKEQV